MLPRLLLLLTWRSMARAEFLRVEVSMKDMDCASCSESLGSAFERLRGVKHVELSMNAGSVILELAEQNRVTLEQVWDAIKRVGFTPGRHQGSRPRRGQRRRADHFRDRQNHRNRRPRAARRKRRAQRHRNAAARSPHPNETADRLKIKLSTLDNRKACEKLGTAHSVPGAPFATRG